MRFARLSIVLAVSISIQGCASHERNQNASAIRFSFSEQLDVLTALKTSAPVVSGCSSVTLGKIGAVPWSRLVRQLRSELDGDGQRGAAYNSEARSGDFKRQMQQWLTSNTRLPFLVFTTPLKTNDTSTRPDTVLYDAGKEEITIQGQRHLEPIVTNYKHNDTAADELTSFIPVSKTSRNGNDYVGQNGFGARVDVSRRYDNYIGVSKPEGVVTIASPLRFAVRRDQAREVINGLSLLYIADLAPPFLTHLSERLNPTFNLPTQYETETSLLHVTYRCIAIYDSVQRRIIASVNFGPAP